MAAGEKRFRVHLFKLGATEGSDDVEDILKALLATDLEARDRNISRHAMRLETGVPPTSACPYWLLDFCKLRFESGPGKASRSTPVESFDLENDQGFAEETAMLFDPITRLCAVQYNHHGPRSGSIAEYLSLGNPTHPNSYELLLQLNPGAQARLEKKKVFTRLEMKVAPSLLSDAFQKADVSMTSYLKQQQQQFGGDYVSIVVGLDRHSERSTLQLSKWVDTFLRMARGETQAVDMLKITCREEPDSVADVVDLISEKLEASFSDLMLDKGLRYQRDSRWAALQRAYNGWVKQRLVSRTP